MISSLMAVRRRGRFPRFWLLPVFFLVLSLHSGAAFSATLTVKVRQINPDGAVQQVTCAEKQKCELPLDIQTGSTKQTLKISVLFTTPRMMIRFQTPTGNLYAGETNPDNKHYYEAFWPRTLSGGKTSTETVTLYSLAGPTPIMVMMVDADREAGLKIIHSVVATVEITTRTAP